MNKNEGSMHVVIDTNIYRKNPTRDHQDFHALSKLGKRNYLILYLPYIIEQEFQTFRILNCKEKLNKIITELNSLLRTYVPSSMEAVLEIKEKIEKNYNVITQNVENEFVEWTNLMNVKRIPLSMNQSNYALKAYFEGMPPFEPKSRKDIPDIFVIKAIEELLEDIEQLVLVCEDGKVQKFFSTNNKVDIYSSLSEFIKSSSIQSELLKIDSISDMEALRRVIKEYEERENQIQAIVKEKIGDLLISEEFESSEILDDNNTATITGFFEPEEVLINLNEVSYFGDNVLGFNFSSNLTVTIEYFIYKADYYSLDEKYVHLPSVSECNDHYFNAEDECEIQVTGTVSIPISSSNLDIEQIENNIIFDDITIDRIENIEFIKF